MLNAEGERRREGGKEREKEREREREREVWRREENRLNLLILISIVL